ncbi:Fumarate hydratase class II [Chlamydiales bacterium SCGC AB-751-O23]|jgi:fumarate hydratase, class II|nr:Fumarate hydratase class II [Chlamydiales bacterium SCGC AB-751-O23]
MRVRIEKDSLGDVEVSDDKYYGAQTQRSLNNFKISHNQIPYPVILAFAIVKKAAAMTNTDLGVLDSEISSTIVKVCDEILEGKIGREHFPLLVWQTGSGTQTNMNVNEVVANRGIEILKGKMGSKEPIHPNDHVNRSQSSNDTFPTAMHIASYLEVKNTLFPSLDSFIKTLKEKEKSFKEIYKIGRTHLMDATPLTLGQEFSAYTNQIENAKKGLENSLNFIAELALGGTAVGTGINSPEGYSEKVAACIAKLTACPFISARNKFQALSTNDAILQMSSSLKVLATTLMKMANDIRWLASGPRCGVGELIIPANEPGSSIMPGKVNPTQCEALTMLCCQVIGNDTAISIANSQGNFELNVYKPVMIYNLLHSIELLSDGLNNFNKKCLSGVEANVPQIKKHLENSLMLATALVPHIGYDTTSKLVFKAHSENKTLKVAALEMQVISEEDFDKIVRPEKMVR